MVWYNAKKLYANQLLKKNNVFKFLEFPDYLSKAHNNCSSQKLVLSTFSLYTNRWSVSFALAQPLTRYENKQNSDSQHEHVFHLQR